MKQIFIISFLVLFFYQSKSTLLKSDWQPLRTSGFQHVLKPQHYNNQAVLCKFISRSFMQLHQQNRKRNMDPALSFFLHLCAASPGFCGRLPARLRARLDGWRRKRPPSVKTFIFSRCFRSFGVSAPRPGKRSEPFETLSMSGTSL